MRVAILGCGPAGLLAAHAAHIEGAAVSIFSKKQPSFIYGAQYLHRPIPLLTKVRPDGKLLLTRLGTREGYALKVYSNPMAFTSWETMMPGMHDIWSMQDTYEKLWDWYEPKISDVDLSDVDVMRQLIPKWDLVVSSVPAKVLCRNPAHKFESQTVWITQAKAEDGPNTQHRITYNGDTGQPWYRWSCIFGHESYEFGEQPHPSSGAVRISKPLDTDCNCGAGILRVGRYGAWKKFLLAHHAFETVRDHVRGRS